MQATARMENGPYIFQRSHPSRPRPPKYAWNIQTLAQCSTSRANNVLYAIAGRPALNVRALLLGDHLNVRSSRHELRCARFLCSLHAQQRPRTIEGVRVVSAFSNAHGSPHLAARGENHELYGTTRCTRAGGVPRPRGFGSALRGGCILS